MLIVAVPADAQSDVKRLTLLRARASIACPPRRRSAAATALERVGRIA
jgi:hypothetical protein